MCSPIQLPAKDHHHLDHLDGDGEGEGDHIINLLQLTVFTFLILGTLRTGGSHVLATADRVLLPGQAPLPHQLPQRVPRPRR